LVHTTPVMAGKTTLKGYVPSPTGGESFGNIYFE
jgi:peptide/nickel transport system substrate-binding protein